MFQCRVDARVTVYLKEDYNNNDFSHHGAKVQNNRKIANQKVI